MFSNSIEGIMREESLNFSRLVCYIIDILIELVKAGVSSIEGRKSKEFLRNGLKVHSVLLAQFPTTSMFNIVGTASQLCHNLPGTSVRALGFVYPALSFV